MYIGCLVPDGKYSIFANYASYTELVRMVKISRYRRPETLSHCVFSMFSCHPFFLDLSSGSEDSPQSPMPIEYVKMKLIVL